MRREYGEALTVAGLANRVHLSRFYFIRKFREQTGQSPYQYLTNLRINQSKKLLCCTEDTVESIARQVGFSDGAGFNPQLQAACRDDALPVSQNICDMATGKSTGIIVENAENKLFCISARQIPCFLTLLY